MPSFDIATFRKDLSALLNRHGRLVKADIDGGQIASVDAALKPAREISSALLEQAGCVLLNTGHTQEQVAQVVYAYADHLAAPEPAG